jgi:hypothetical protein
LKGANRKAPQVGAPSHRLRRLPPHTKGCRSGVCGFTHGLSGAWQGRKGTTSLGRDAQGLTFSAVIPARVMQPGFLTRGNQNWRIALCCYGMTFTPRHRVHLLCVASLVHLRSAHRLGDLWPDSLGGRGSGWLPGLPSSSNYAFLLVVVGSGGSSFRTPNASTIHASASGTTTSFGRVALSHCPTTGPWIRTARTRPLMPPPLPLHPALLRPSPMPQAEPHPPGPLPGRRGAGSPAALPWPLRGPADPPAAAATTALA